MGNFFKDLGGALLSPGGTKTKIQQQETLSPEQKAMFNNMLSGASSQYGQPTESAPFQTYAPTTEQEQKYFDFVNTQSPQNQASNEALLNVLSGKPAYEINPEATEQYYQKYIRDPALRNYKETTAPLLAESFSGPGYWSSGRANATQQSITDLSSQLDAQRAELYYKDELARRQALENARNLQIQGISVAPNYYGQQANQLGTAGALARQIEQEKISSNMARWLSGEQMEGKSIGAYNPNTQLALSLLGVQPFTYSTQQTTTGKGLLPSIMENLKFNVNYGQAGGAGGGGGTA